MGFSFALVSFLFSLFCFQNSFEKSEEVPSSVLKKSNEKSLAQNVLKSLLSNAKELDVSDSVGTLSDVSGHLEEMEEGLEDVLDVSINSSEDESRVSRESRDFFVGGPSI